MHLPAIIRDLALILGVAAIVTFIFRRIKQPVVLGYILAGLIVGPYTPPILSVVDKPNINILAELGVIFLMFSLGLEFSFRRLMRVGMSASVTATVQIAVMIVLGFFSGRLMGWNVMDAIFVAAMVSISSTTIIIKAFEELHLKTKRFAELVFGILIVEDLAAIVMMVALTSIATRETLSAMELLITGTRLGIVVGGWFLVGMFLVPRAVKAVSRHGNDEMLTVLATGLCLGLVTLSAYFHYSVALGAFIMGSILAESSEAKRIEHLMQPIRDVFGAVFFVSVGMLLDPAILFDSWTSVLVLTMVVIVGKLVAVSAGALATGQSVQTSVQTGFSMAQIGEFSFIIATLGMSYNVINERLYPVIVATSLITTFTTPYFIKWSGPAAKYINDNLPDRTRANIDRYITWFQRRSVKQESRQLLLRRLGRWFANAVIVISVFAVVASQFIPWAAHHILDQTLLSLGAWLIAFLISAPFIWAMFTTFRPGSSGIRGNVPEGLGLIVSRLGTVLMIGLLSIEYFPIRVALSLTVAALTLIFFIFRQRVENYYRWFEMQLSDSFQSQQIISGHPTLHKRLAPWDAHLADVVVQDGSFLVGRSLIELQLREKYGLNVVMIKRGKRILVAPKAAERLYPNDVIMCFATDSEIEKFREDVKNSPELAASPEDMPMHSLRRFVVEPQAKMEGKTIRDTGITENYDGIVVGLERGTDRLRSPRSDMRLENGDVLWVVGDAGKLLVLAKEFNSIN